MSIYLRVFLAFWITLTATAFPCLIVFRNTLRQGTFQPLALRLPQLHECVAASVRALGRQRAEAAAAECGVLLIERFDGEDSVGWHADRRTRQLAAQVKANTPFALDRMQNALLVAFAASVDASQYVAVAQLPIQTPNFVRLLLSLILISAISSAIGCLVLAHSFIDPILKLRGYIGAFAEGNLDARPDPMLLCRNDELGELCLFTSQMLSRVRQRLTAQQEFLMKVSQELSLSLGSLKSALAEAKRSSVSSSRMDLSLIEYETTRIESTADRLGQLSQLESSTEPLGKSLFSLHTLMLEVCQDNRSTARDHGKQLQLVSSLQIHLWGYRASLKFALDHIIRGFLCVAARSSQVRVFSGPTPEGDAVLIQVKDCEISGADGEFAELFEPAVRERGEPFLGLDLAFAKRALLPNGGTVKVTSASSGGVLVEIALPSGVDDN